MSAPRLILKQPSGWFAAGREFAQAITLLSDGAFKLYVHACLMANRHTGRLSATVDELARAMTRAPTAVTMSLDELEERAVCRVIRNGGSQLVVEIRDRFWPYQRQQTPGCASEPEAEFVRKVRGLFLASACVQASFSAADEKIAAGHHRGSERVSDTGKLLGTASHEGDADGTTMAPGESSKTLTPQPVGQSSTAPHHTNTCPHRRNACPDPT